MKPPSKRWPKGTWMRLKSGPLLRELMNTRQLSNEDVARSVGCARTFISALVNERKTSCKVVTAERIAERLQVPVEVLFDPRQSGDAVSSDKRRAA